MGLAGKLLAARYRLDEPIGKGGFSEVWRATDTVLARPVAVKLLHPGRAQQPEVLARFRAEARNAAALWHVNIAHSYDYDEPADGLQPYLVMELVDGPCLAGVLAGGPLSAARTMDIVAQAAAGLQAAHATGLIHRDIKPGNLLLASDGTVKITDFGISHAIGSAPVTITGVVMGTAEYLAPERIAGAPAGPASDLYALGIVAYQCLAGAPPFTGEPLDVACAHRDRPVPPLPPSVSAGVTALVMQLLAKDPAWRPGSAAEVAHRAGRLRDDPRDSLSIGAGRARYPLPAPAAAPPSAPVIAPAALAGDGRWPVPTARRHASGARTGARRLRRRPVPVLASATIAGLIIMVLAVTIGAVSIRHPVVALPSAPSGHPAGATAAPPPVRPPSSSPGRPARRRTSPGDTGVLQMDASDHRISTATDSGRGKFRRHRYGKEADQGQDRRNGHGYRQGQGNGDGYGQGQGNGDGYGQGQGNGDGYGQGQGNGDGKGSVLSILSQPPTENLAWRSSPTSTARTGNRAGVNGPGRIRTRHGRTRSLRRLAQWTGSILGARSRTQPLTALDAPGDFARQIRALGQVCDQGGDETFLHDGATVLGHEPREPRVPRAGRFRAGERG
jgi:eukaryotic-like serine/threonine-protein kinase